MTISSRSFSLVCGLACLALACSAENGGLGGMDADFDEEVEDGGADRRRVDSRTAGTGGGGAGGAGGAGTDAARDGTTSDAKAADGASDGSSGDAPAPSPDGPGADMAPAPIDAPPPDMAPPPPKNQNNGATCTDKSQCKSGFCVDGVCCDKACDNGCSACVRSRTGRSDGTCSAAPDRNAMACGSACANMFSGVPAVVEMLCSAGSCVVPMIPRTLQTCFDEDPCTRNSCDANTSTRQARCVAVGCDQGSCCCRSSNNTRQCMRTDQCRGNDRSCQ